MKLAGQVFAAIAVAIAILMWIACAWLAFSADETWTQYRRDMIGFSMISGIVFAGLAAIALSLAGDDA